MWMESLIGFDASDCPKNMAGAGQLLLLIYPTITNVRMYHVLVDGGVALNLIDLVAFEKLQIAMSRLTPSCPFSGVGAGSIIPCSSNSLSITFRTPKNYRTKSVVFNITEVNLPFNAILSRLALYQVMTIAHYGYLVLKMSSPNGVIKVCGDRSSSVLMLVKLTAMAVAKEAIVGYGG
jgi:hypothetical protein